MPFAMKPIEITSQFDNSSSVLIVACHICPRMCLAADNGQPYFSFTQFITGKDFFTSHINSIQKTFTQKNIRSHFFKSFFPVPMMCLWLAGQRDRLAKCISGHDAIAVFGCESAVATVTDSVKAFQGPVVQIMSVEGIANFIPKIGFPFSIELKRSATGIVPLPQKNPE